MRSEDKGSQRQFSPSLEEEPWAEIRFDWPHSLSNYMTVVSRKVLVLRFVVKLSSFLYNRSSVVCMQLQRQLKQSLAAASKHSAIRSLFDRFWYRVVSTAYGFRLRVVTSHATYYENIDLTSVGYWLQNWLIYDLRHRPPLPCGLLIWIIPPECDVPSSRPSRAISVNESINDTRPDEAEVLEMRFELTNLVAFHGYPRPLETVESFEDSCSDTRSTEAVNSFDDNCSDVCPVEAFCSETQINLGRIRW